MVETKRVLILGAGFTGLAAALELETLGIPTLLVERSNEVAGLSRTFNLAGLKFELGPHIYFDKDPEVTGFWRKLIGDKLKTFQRNNRIFYNGKYIKSPLSLSDTFFKLGPLSVGRILWSYAKSYWTHRKIESAEDWVKSNFGFELFNRFFKVYNEKIWGIPCSEMAADWAGNRIRSSLTKMIYKSVTRDHNFIIKTFDFPTGGSETLYKKQVSQIEASKHVKLELNCETSNITSMETGYEVTLGSPSRKETFSHIISTIHLDSLVNIFSDSSPFDKRKVQEAISNLKYRNLILVNFVLNRNQVQNFKEHWIDIHDPKIKALRVTNFGNHELGLVDGERCGICVEFNCWDNDELWNLSEKAMTELALSELKIMGLLTSDSVVASSVIRIPKAYPVYFKEYQNYLNTVFEELDKLKGIILAGRNSLYKWNNMHHSVKTGLLAARNVAGANHDLKAVKGLIAIGKDSD